MVTLYITSLAKGSGRTAVCAGIGQHMCKEGKKVGFFSEGNDSDAAFVQSILDLKEPVEQISPVLGESGKLPDQIKKAVDQVSKGKDVVIVEGSNSPEIARALKAKVIIVDTAGRHKEEKELIAEMKKIESILKPNEVILVIDGTLGQQAFSQAEEFAKATNIGSLIVTKLDGTAKGGGALSACAATNASIRFIGTGEKMDAFEEFEPTAFIGTLLGRPNLEALVQKVQDAEAMADPERPVADLTYDASLCTIKSGFSAEGSAGKQ